ncbi:MAG: AAA family ATPase [Cyanobium sp.]
MLKRLYVDNFRCLVDFELNFDSINLFLGDNGAGKSTVFDILGKLQRVITTDISVDSTFNKSDCTYWQNYKNLKFELDVEGNGGIYKYQLEITSEDIFYGHVDATISVMSIASETLRFNQENLLRVNQYGTEIIDLNGQLKWTDRYIESRSIIPLLKAKDDYHKILWFKDRIKRLATLKITPNSIVSESLHKSEFLETTMGNFVSWYRYIFADNQNKLAQLTKSLQEILDGFISFRLEPISEKAVILKLIFKTEESEQNIEYTFEELSDGQKVLVILYSLFYGLESQDYTLCIDEPENFLALPEIQPWLFQLEDLCSEGKLQALLISHHPQLIDYLLSSPIGYWFERQANSSVKVKPINSELQKCNESGLSMSELIARRWLSE